MKKYPVLVAVAGPRGSGKSTFAQALAEYLRDLNLEVRVLAFADGIRDICQSTLGFTPEQMEAGKEIPICPLPLFSEIRQVELVADLTPRLALQTIGQCLRNLRTDVWSQQVLGRARRLVLQGVDVVIIQDMRHHSEQADISEAGGLIFKRDKLTHVPSTYDLHPSECQARDLLADVVVPWLPEPPSKASVGEWAERVLEQVVPLEERIKQDPVLALRTHLWKVANEKKVGPSELARRLGTSRAYTHALLWSSLHGKSPPSFRSLLRVAKALDVDVGLDLSSEGER